MFKSIVTFLIEKLEGGYGDLPGDPGGETKYGISKRSFPKEDIKNLTPKRAMEIYEEHFWKEMGLHNLRDIHYRLALTVFCCGVNVGPERAVKWMQLAVNDAIWERELHENKGVTSLLVQDGAYGPKTDATLKKVVNRRSRALEASNRVLSSALTYYARPGMPPYLRSWTNRVAIISEEVAKRRTF